MPQIYGVAKKSETFLILKIFYWKHDKATLKAYTNKHTHMSTLQLLSQIKLFVVSL